MLKEDLMHLIAYVSNYSKDSDTIEQDLEDITKLAKIENIKRQITGVLFFMQGKFLQIIEGEEDDLRQLLVNIENDARNESIEILIDTKIEKRGFSDWNMDSFNLSNDKEFNRDNLRILSKSFEKNLLPRSDVLVIFYKKILEKSQS